MKKKSKSKKKIKKINPRHIRTSEQSQLEDHVIEDQFKKVKLPKLGIETNDKKSTG